jgi:hypothetical protein
MLPVYSHAQTEQVLVLKNPLHPTTTSIRNSMLTLIILPTASRNRTTKKDGKSCASRQKFNQQTA